MRSSRRNLTRRKIGMIGPRYPNEISSPRGRRRVPISGRASRSTRIRRRATYSNRCTPRHRRLPPRPPRRPARNRRCHGRRREREQCKHLRQITIASTAHNDGPSLRPTQPQGRTQRPCSQGFYLIITERFQRSNCVTQPPGELYNHGRAP